MRDLERLAEENSKLINELDDVKQRISSIEAERDSVQKKLTKQVNYQSFIVSMINTKSFTLNNNNKNKKIQIHDNEMKIKAADFLTKTKTLEDNHSRAMFDLRQLLNMQQRMSNK